MKMRLDKLLAIALGENNGQIDDGIEQALNYAYWAGCTDTAREICDEHTRRGVDAIKRAKKSRYWRHCINVIGDAGSKIYNVNYSGAILADFAADEIDLPAPEQAQD